MKWCTVHNLQMCVCVCVSFPNAGGHSDEEEEHLETTEVEGERSLEWEGLL